MHGCPISLTAERRPSGRAVDAEGEVLDVLVQSKRNKHAALKLMRKLLRVRPLFDFETATVNGRNRDDGATEVFSATGDGAVCMQAVMQWA